MWRLHIAANSCKQYLHLNEIRAESAAWPQAAGLQVSSVNRSLQVLRRVMRLAGQSGEIEVALPHPGEKQVLSGGGVGMWC